MRNKKALFFFVFIGLSCLACSKPLPRHEIHGEILLKDNVFLTITSEFIVETPEALHEVRIKKNQLEFAVRIALREHASTELMGRGERLVSNGLKSIARQVLKHPVKDIRITTYTFHENPMIGKK
ncbi:MAG: hypothetical protein KKD44_24875 [Proteobacteria bacterium]|nr:hypothetical protein [Pseudomonadota bacterium]